MSTRWNRPRGQRKIPPARSRAVSDPYGPLHRRIRAALLAQLAAAGGWPCPLCSEMMHAWMGRALHLHHPGGLAAKLAGQPGSVLVHGACNLSSGGKDGAQVTNASKAKRATVTPIRTVTANKPSRASRDW